MDNAMQVQDRAWRRSGLASLVIETLAVRWLDLRKRDPPQDTHRVREQCPVVMERAFADRRTDGHLPLRHELLERLTLERNSPATTYRVCR